MKVLSDPLAWTCTDVLHGGAGADTIYGGGRLSLDGVLPVQGAVRMCR